VGYRTSTQTWLGSRRKNRMASVVTWECGMKSGLVGLALVLSGLRRLQLWNSRVVVKKIGGIK
jgi:hypothetical protein